MAAKKKGPGHGKQFAKLMKGLESIELHFTRTRYKDKINQQGILPRNKTGRGIRWLKPWAPNDSVFTFRRFVNPKEKPSKLLASIRDEIESGLFFGRWNDLFQRHGGMTIFLINRNKITKAHDISWGKHSKIPKEAIVGSIDITRKDVGRIRLDLLRAGVFPFNPFSPKSYKKQLNRGVANLVAKRGYKLLKEKGYMD